MVMNTATKRLAAKSLKLKHRMTIRPMAENLAVKITIEKIFWQNH